MNDYIRKAVELADGWRIRSGMNIETGSIWLIQGPDKFLSCLVSEPKSYMLDALAAQLVRQVDALRTPSASVITSDLGSITIWRNRQILAASINDDRTTNTIKAIVDSGVLK